MTDDNEEITVLRARLALSPVQVEAMEQEIAELKQEHGVLSGQLHEIREAVRKYFAGPDEPAWCGEDATDKAADDGYVAMERIRAILDREPLPGNETEVLS